MRNVYTLKCEINMANTSMYTYSSSPYFSSSSSPTESQILKKSVVLPSLSLSKKLNSVPLAQLLGSSFPYSCEVTFVAQHAFSESRPRPFPAPADLGFENLRWSSPLHGRKLCNFLVPSADCRIFKTKKTKNPAFRVYWLSLGFDVATLLWALWPIILLLWAPWPIILLTLTWALWPFIRC